MRYIVAGYVFVLTVLFLYALSLTWRRRRLERTVARVTAGTPSAATSVSAAAPSDPMRTADSVASVAPGGDT